MPLSELPSIGHPIPNVRHAVSVQIPTWQDMCDLPLGIGRVKQFQQIGYPRSFLHPSIQKLNKACIDKLNLGANLCLLFSSLDSAEACKASIISVDEDLHSSSKNVSIHSLGTSIISTRGQPYQLDAISIYGVSFPGEYHKQAMIFWRLTGLGISSRMADDCLNSLDSLQILSAKEPLTSSKQKSSSAYKSIRERIAAILSDSPQNGRALTKISKDDVYLYQSGMAAIYHLHRVLLRWRGTRSVVFGFPYELTLKMLETYGPGCQFFASATSLEIDELETHLDNSRIQGEDVQAIWCECPSNPLLRTPDFDRLRQLADQYQVPLIVDETIGGFANVDLLDVADILVTSLTKSFSGYSDVMGGSIVLNPCSQFYSTLQSIFQISYRNELHVADAIKLESNSRDFYSRTTRINRTTLALVDFFQQSVSCSSIPITTIYHPSTCWSAANYRKRMRPCTEKLESGHGSVFTLEFATVAAARTFFDASNLHKGPSLGASVTLLQPYVQTVFYKEKAWAARHGLNETIIRISVGLEDQNSLLKAFQDAVQIMMNTLVQPDPWGKLRETDLTESSHMAENGFGAESFQKNICV